MGSGFFMSFFYIDFFVKRANFTIFSSYIEANTTRRKNKK